MNSLSWFLYLADVFSSVQTLLTMLGIFGIIIGIAVSIGVYVETKKKWPIIIPIISFLMLVVSVFIPSKSTMYAIAASEVGEQAVQSELGQKSLKAIEVWIESQVSKQKK